MAYPPTWVRVSAREPSQYTRFIQRVCDTRGLRSDVNTSSDFSSDHFQISERLTSISGFWPSVEFLLAKYPEPELLHGDSISRCLARSLTHDLLAMGKVDGSFLGPLQNGAWQGTFPVGQHKLSLIDIAYLAVLSPASPSYRRLDAEFARYVTDQLKLVAA